MSNSDFYKNMLLARGGSVTKADTKHSKVAINRKFSQDPSYKKGKVVKLDMTVEDIDFRMVNIDKSVSNKKLYFRPDIRLREGDLINCDDKCYLIDEFEDNLISPYAKATLCNETINSKGFESPQPCIVEGESYGVKIVSSNDLREGVDTKVKITVPNNIIMRQISPNNRYIFNNSKYGIYEVGDITVYNKGKLILTCKKSDYREEDDLENNIAFNEGVDIPTELPTTYAIIGEENVRKGKEYLYTLSPKEENIEWSISDDTVATMRIDDDKNCILCILKSDDYITLNASLDGKIIASKDLFTM